MTTVLAAAIGAARPGAREALAAGEDREASIAIGSAGSDVVGALASNECPARAGAARGLAATMGVVGAGAGEASAVDDDDAASMSVTSGARDVVGALGSADGAAWAGVAAGPGAARACTREATIAKEDNEASISVGSARRDVSGAPGSTDGAGRAAVVSGAALGDVGAGAGEALFANDDKAASMFAVSVARDVPSAPGSAEDAARGVYEAGPLSPLAADAEAFGGSNPASRFSKPEPWPRASD